MSIKEQFVSASMDQLGLLETRLNGLLKPVAPRQEFINSLRDRIHVTQNPAIISRFTNIQFVFMMVLSVISGVVLVTMGARVLVSLLSLRKKTPNLQ
jgi:hypothetical protein